MVILQKSAIDAILFDAVGTLIFPEPTASVVYAEFAARHGQLVEREQLSQSLWQQFRREEEFDQVNNWHCSEEREHQRWQNIVQAALPGSNRSVFEELFEHFARPTSWRVAIDAAAKLSELANAGFQLGLASNYDARLRRVVAGLPELAILAPRLFISSELGYRKPSPHFYQQCASVLGIVPQRIAMIGDDWGNDYLGAKEAGLLAVHLTDTPKPEAMLNSIQNLSELHYSSTSNS